MGGKIAIIIASDWDQKLKVTSGLHLAKRIYEVRQANGVDVYLAEAQIPDNHYR